MRDYFIKHPDFTNTEFANTFLWMLLIELRKKKDKGDYKPVIQLRTGPRGTVTRYGADLRGYLARQGGRRLHGFYNSRKAALAAKGE